MPEAFVGQEVCRLRQIANGEKPQLHLSYHFMSNLFLNKKNGEKFGFVGKISYFCARNMHF